MNGRFPIPKGATLEIISEIEHAVADAKAHGVDCGCGGRITFRGEIMRCDRCGYGAHFEIKKPPRGADAGNDPCQAIAEQMGRAAARTVANVVRKALQGETP